MQLYVMFLFPMREFCFVEMDKDVGLACKF